MTTPNPKPKPTQFFPNQNSFLIGATPCPGIARLVSAERKFGWDIKKGSGLSGATVVPIGDELVVAKFHIEIWDEVKDWPAFLLFRKKYLSNAIINPKVKDTSPKAMTILHSELIAMGVSSVVLLSITPMVNDGFGCWECDCEFLQYRMPVLAKPRPDAAIPPDVQGKVTAKDAAQAEMQQKTAVIQDLGNQVAHLFVPGFVPPNR